MSNGRAVDRPGNYQIRVQGALESKWADWFDGFTITPDGKGETTLTGRVTDQAELHGLLTRIRDLGLPLISVQRVRLDQERRGNHREDGEE